MKLDKGLCKTRHHTRPRTVDQGKKLFVSTDRELSEREVSVPQLPPIAVPVVTTRQNYFAANTIKYLRTGHYHRYSVPDETALDAQVEYEATAEDFAFYSALLQQFALKSGEFPVKRLEQCIDLFEKDTVKGQIIPLERALMVLKEQQPAQLPPDQLLEAVYLHWKARREEEQRPLLRRFWRSEGIGDAQLKLVFQPRNPARKMSLRNSRKNDDEAYERVTPIQMLSIESNFKYLLTLTDAVIKREEIKKYCCLARVTSFEYERTEKGLEAQNTESEDNVRLILDHKTLEDARNFRESVKLTEPPPAPSPISPLSPLPQPKISAEIPMRRPRPEPQRKSSLSFDVSRVCALLISDGEASGLWPLASFMDLLNESKPVESEMLPSKANALKHRGRYGRGGRFICLDRFSSSEFGHIWGRYRDNRGKWHTQDSEDSGQLYDEEDDEDINRLRKLISHGFKPFLKQRKAASGTQ